MPASSSHRPTKNFFKMSNQTARRRTLSFGAKGLYSLLLSFPDGEEFSVAIIARYSDRGGYHIRTLLAELVAANLVEISTPKQTRAEHSGGRFVAEKFRLSGGGFLPADDGHEEREFIPIPSPNISQSEPISGEDREAFADALAALDGGEY